MERTSVKFGKRAQASTEYLMLLAAVLVIVGSIVTVIYLTSAGLGSSVGGKIDNTMENTVVPGLVGAFLG